MFLGFVHTREVWWCSLGANVGYEQDGKHDFFERPVLIIKKFSRDSVLVVPITSQGKENPYHIVFMHNNTKNAVIISQIRLMSTKRLRRKLYSMNTKTFDNIRDGIKKMV